MQKYLIGSIIYGFYFEKNDKIQIAKILNRAKVKGKYFAFAHKTDESADFKSTDRKRLRLRGSGIKREHRVYVSGDGVGAGYRA